MTHIFEGRYTHDTDRDEFVLFRIGMRINRLHRPDTWWPVFNAMPPMLRELETNPGLGLLHTEYDVGWRRITLTQYWASFAQLEQFARSPDLPHLPAWREFNRRVRASGDVGIFHETFVVAADRAESIYGNMPRTGLAAATAHVPVGSVAQSARSRIDRSAPDEPAVEPY